MEFPTIAFDLKMYSQEFKKVRFQPNENDLGFLVNNSKFFE